MRQQNQSCGIPLLQKVQIIPRDFVGQICSAVDRVETPRSLAAFVFEKATEISRKVPGIGETYPWASFSVIEGFPKKG